VGHDQEILRQLRLREEVVDRVVEPDVASGVVTGALIGVEMDVVVLAFVNLARLLVISRCVDSVPLMEFEQNWRS